jgi:hypothetical protein
MAAWEPILTKVLPPHLLDHCDVGLLYLFLETHGYVEGLEALLQFISGVCFLPVWTTGSSLRLYTVTAGALSTF